MGLPKNTIIREVAPKSVFDDMSALVSSAVSFSQGDLLVLDTSAHLIKAAASGEVGTNFLGVARCSISSGKLVSPYQGTDVDSSEGLNPLPGPVYGVTAKVICKTSDAFNPGDKIYIYADTANARMVTSTAGSQKPIGVYQGPAITSAAAAQEIEVLIGAQYPNDVCTF